MLKKLDAEALFDDWAQRGRAEGMERGHSVRGVQALRQIPIENGQRLLDLGCGNGWATRWLAVQTGNTGSAIGVDAAAGMIALAREHQHNSSTVRFERCTFTELPFADASFDHAFSMEALYYATELAPALDSIARVVKSGGTLTICVDYFTENPHSVAWPTNVGVPMIRLSEHGWQAALESAGFEVKASFRCLDDRPVDPSRPEEERAAKLDFQTRIGTLALRGQRRRLRGQ
jgi:arsenite methyltransferase